MDFRILGPLAVVDEGREITPTAPKVRQVLSFLLIRRNQIVQVSELIDELWSSNPPDSAITTLQTYIYKLRKDVLAPSGPTSLHTRASGYLLHVSDDDVDVCAFEKLSVHGRHALQGGDAQKANELLTKALGLWRGNALIGVTTGDILAAYVTRLEENRLRALEMRIEANMSLGRYQELISELKQLVFTYPLHERFHADLMTALNRSGRRYEALEVYRRLREVVIDELGLEPSAPLQRLHQSLLSADTSDTAQYAEHGARARVTVLAHRQANGSIASLQEEPAEVRTEVQEESRAEVATDNVETLTVPAQLPPDTSDFTGRTGPLKELRQGLAPRGDESTTARTVSICGMAGVGKTALALHAAHIDRALHPDGQLFADLRGASPDPAIPADVLADFLRSVGVPHHQIPGTLEERSKLFRTWCNGRRVLIVLDDAACASQVTSLLPATPQCAVIITSRWGMSLPGVPTLELDLMDLGEGVEFLGRIIGCDRIMAEEESAEKIVGLCGHLPLALRCVGARLATMRTWSLEKMVALLKSGPDLLDQLRFADFDVRACYDSTYSRLDPPDRSTFRLLSLLPPRRFSAITVAGLVGSHPDTVESQLNRLVSCHLLHMTHDDGDEAHYQLHKLTRLYAQECLNREFLQPKDLQTS